MGAIDSTQFNIDDLYSLNYYRIDFDGNGKSVYVIGGQEKQRAEPRSLDERHFVSLVSEDDGRIILYVHTILGEILRLRSKYYILMHSYTPETDAAGSNLYEMVGGITIKPVFGE